MDKQHSVEALISLIEVSSAPLTAMEQRMKKAVRVAAWLMFGLLISATAALFVVSVLRFKVAAAGTSAEYWEYLCGVQLPAFSGHYRYSRSGGLYPTMDGKAYYYSQTHHEQLLYVVQVDDVLQDVPAVRKLLKSPQAPPDSACTGYGSVCEIYSQGEPRRAACNTILNGAGKGDPNHMLDSLRTALADKENAAFDNRDSDAAFRDRINRGHRVWLTFVFEAMFFGAWFCFSLGVRPFEFRWYWRVGLAPFLLFLPYFLGYAPLTFTFGPSGGFVYPAYLMLASLPMSLVPCNPIDAFMWPNIPNLLGWLSQIPGSPLAATYTSCVGPVSALMFGFLVVALAWSILYIRGKSQRWNRA